MTQISEADTLGFQDIICSNSDSKFLGDQLKIFPKFLISVTHFMIIQHETPLGVRFPEGLITHNSNDS